MQETQKAQVRSLGQEDPRGGRKWHPTPVFMAGKSHGQKSLAGYSPWVCKESDTTELLGTQNKVKVDVSQISSGAAY